MRYAAVLTLLAPLCLVETVAAKDSLKVEVIDLASHFPDIPAAFVLSSLEGGWIKVYNPERARTGFIPASTFKIPNSIIALETGVASGPDFMLQPDTTVTPPQAWWPTAWRRGLTLRSAFANSVVWYYQELARRIGEDRMRDYVYRLGYGNQHIGGGIDRFWLDGDLRVSALEQVTFLERLLTDRLGISASTTRIVRDIMLIEDTLGCRLSGKTGTAADSSGTGIAWLVGFAETRDTVYIYALNLDTPQVMRNWPRDRRVALVRSVLREQGIIR